jgi:hypothetical protein
MTELDTWKESNRCSMPLHPAGGEQISLIE